MAYNKIKRERNVEYHQANLENALSAVAELFVVALRLYPQQARLGELVPSPELLRPDDGHFGGVTHGGFEFGFNYIHEGRQPLKQAGVQ